MFFKENCEHCKTFYKCSEVYEYFKNYIIDKIEYCDKKILNNIDFNKILNWF